MSLGPSVIVSPRFSSSLVVLGLPTFPPFILDRCFTLRIRSCATPPPRYWCNTPPGWTLLTHLFLGRWKVLDLQCKLLDWIKMNRIPFQDMNNHELSKMIPNRVVLFLQLVFCWISGNFLGRYSSIILRLLWARRFPWQSTIKRKPRRSISCITSEWSILAIRFIRYWLKCDVSTWLSPQLRCRKNPRV